MMFRNALKIVLGGLLAVTVVWFVTTSNIAPKYSIHKKEKFSMTPDIKRLQENLVSLRDTLDQIEFEFIDDPHSPEPSDTSYLNETARADPDTMANVEAMDATNKLIAWFGRDQEGGFVGFWRGPENTPLERAPVVRLDNEGQYDLVAATVPDYIAVADMEEDRFDDARAALLAVGFEVATSRDEIWKKLDGMSDPNAFRGELYDQGRRRRGLK